MRPARLAQCGINSHSSEPRSARAPSARSFLSLGAVMHTLFAHFGRAGAIARDFRSSWPRSRPARRAVRRPGCARGLPGELCVALAAARGLPASCGLPWLLLEPAGDPRAALAAASCQRRCGLPLAALEPAGELCVVLAALQACRRAAPRPGCARGLPGDPRAALAALEPRRAARRPGPRRTAGELCVVALAALKGLPACCGLPLAESRYWRRCPPPNSHAV
jgi:hypothetical protein